MSPDPDRSTELARSLRTGLAAYAQDDYAGAFRQLDKAAQAGDAEAQYRLGLLYARGKGVIGNLGDAIAWYRRAAEQGHAEAQHQLSLAYLDGGRAHYGVDHWYDGAAEIDQSAADSNLELMFPNGISVAQDHPEALRWSLAAAEQGLAGAQAIAGMMYARGLGCEVDYAAARHLYLKAAEQGEATAEFGLGVLYANGFGVEIDLPAAAGWYEKAAAKGHSDAQAALGLMCASGSGIERDPAGGRTQPRQGPP